MRIEQKRFIRGAFFAVILCSVGIAVLIQSLAVSKQNELTKPIGPFIYYCVLSGMIGAIAGIVIGGSIFYGIKKLSNIKWMVTFTSVVLSVLIGIIIGTLIGHAMLCPIFQNSGIIQAHTFGGPNADMDCIGGMLSALFAGINAIIFGTGTGQKQINKEPS